MKRSACFYRTKYRSMLAGGTMIMAMTFLMSFCDCVIAGQMIGADSVAAINIVAPLIGISTFVAECISEGVSILYTRAIGAMQRERADQIYGMGMTVTIILAGLSTLFLVVFRDLYFEAAGATGAILGYARDYYRFLPLSIPIMILCWYIEQAVYSDGGEKLVVISYTAQIAVNIAASVILVKHMGLAGIMLGTVAGNAAAVLVMSIHYLKKSCTLHFVLYFSWKDLLQCVKYSVTDALIYLLWGVVNYILISFISHHYDEKYLVVLAVVISLVEFTVLFDGIGLAIQPLMGVYYGERNHLMIKRLMKDAIITAVLEGVVATAILFVFAPSFVGIFGITDPEMQKAAVTAVRIVSLSLTASSLFMLETSYYLYIDRIGISTAATGLKDGILYAALPLAFSAIWGINGLWAGIAAAPVLGIAVSMLFIYLRFGKERFPSLLETQESEIIVFDTVLSVKSMTDASLAVQEQMKQHNYPDKTALLAAMFVEEISATVREKNGNARVLMEYSLMFEKNGVRLVIRDTGEIFDVTDPDLQLTGISSYFLSRLLDAQKEKGYVPTNGYNRNQIRFDYIFYGPG